MSGVGGRIAEERKLAGLTQQQFGTRANVSTSLVRAVEQGRLPRLARIRLGCVPGARRPGCRPARPALPPAEPRGSPAA
ncbi:MAG: helix-turn-helix domain-containing protein [Actinomycetota bacterium]|nr:helix-turn-helix domain-containing protein [Actinomycetota bacterium]